jgi:tyrosyl-tRNA synthetase
MLEQNPRDVKVKLALEIVKIYHGEKKAEEAEENFINTFQKKEIPEVMQEIKAKKGELLSEILVENKILASKSEWRRLVLENAVHDLLKNENIKDVNLKITENLTLKIGKKKFIKIINNPA